MEEKINKKYIIAGLLEMPQPGAEVKLLLELPDGCRVREGKGLKNLLDNAYLEIIEDFWGAGLVGAS